MEEYQDAKQRARKALTELENNPQPPYKKVDRALSAFKGLILSSIPYNMRMTVESVMMIIQQIFNRYQIETIEDYRFISEDDLDEMMNHTRRARHHDVI